jgi:hypothetical protein
VKPIANVTDSVEAHLAVVEAVILDHEGGIPVESFRSL